MSTVFEVWLDEERQIVRQRVYRDPDLAEFRELVEESRECARRLRCPTAVRILVDGSGLGRMSRSVRAHADASLRAPELKRMAIVTQKRAARLVIRFLAVATGLDKARAFADEAEALRWLAS